MINRTKRILVGTAAAVLFAVAAVPLANSGEFVRPALFADGTITEIGKMTRTVDVDGVTYVVGGGVDMEDMRPGDDVSIAYVVRDGERIAITVLPQHSSGADNPD